MRLHQRLALAVTLLAIVSCGIPSRPVDDVFYLRSAGADMPVWVRGDLSAHVVIVYIAGGPGGPGMIEEESPAFRRLTEKYVVAFWDQRASGGTSGGATPDSLTLEQYATDLDGVVQVLAARYGNPSIFLLGHSWGGLVGTAYLADPQRQARITGWIDVDGLHNMSKSMALSRQWAMAEASARMAQGNDVDRWNGDLAWYASHPVIGCADFRHHGEILLALEPTRHPEKLPAIGSLSLNLVSPFDGMSTLANLGLSVGESSKGGSALCKAVFTDLTSSLPNITIPSLVIWGRFDRGLPVAMADEAYALLGSPSGSKSLVILEDSEHMCLYDESELFATAVEQFVDANHP